MEKTNVTYEAMDQAFTQYERKIAEENKKKGYYFGEIESPTEEKKNPKPKPKEIEVFKINFEGEDRPKNLMEEKIRKMYDVQKLKNLSSYPLFNSEK